MRVLLVMFGFYIIKVNSYVLVQVKKGDSLSNVDAIIHKKIPSDKLTEFTDRLSRFTGPHSAALKINKEGLLVGSTGKQFKRFEVRKRTDDAEEQEIMKVETTADNTNPGDNTLQKNKNIDSLLLSINTGVNPEEYTPSPEKPPDAIDKLHQVIGQLAKANFNPIYRAQEEYQLKPEVVHFNSANPTLKYEINSDSIIKVLQDLLTSDTVKQYTDLAARKAAVVYRTIKEEMRKDENDKTQ